jgi:hypothetical protein
MATVKIHNPSAPEVQSRNAIGAFPPIRESRAGVLENSKQHAELVMTEILRQLGERHGVIHAYTGHKLVAEPAPQPVVDEMAGSCEWALVGSAD